jgi:nickel-dependent lactate racemase
LTTELEVPFGERTLSVSLPPETEVTILSPAEKGGLLLEEALKKGLAQPVGAESVDYFLKDCQHLLVLVNDLFRPTPTAQILSNLHPYLRSITQLGFLVATGLHPKPSPEDLRSIFGMYYDGYRKNIFSHDCDNESQLVNLGKTSFGSEVNLHKLVLKASHILTISSVEPHYFSGFTGGRKMFLPGISSRRATQNNHALALSEEAQPLSLEGNLVHQDMEEALDFLGEKKIFSIQVVSANSENLQGCFCGDIREAFYSAVQKARQVFTKEVEERFDIVVAVVGPPLDKNLYQIQKSMEHAKMALKERGIIILVSPCYQGIGNDEWLKLSEKFLSWEEVLTSSEEWNLGFHKLYRTAQLRRWAQIWAVTTLSSEILRRVYIEPKESLQRALDEALSIKGRACNLLLLMDAGRQVPVLQSVSS